MANLTGKTIFTTYDQVLNLPGPMEATTQSVTDGVGNATGIEVSNTNVNIATGWTFTINGSPVDDGGETNTCSNIGIAGTGLFKQKTGVNFEFKKLNAGSTKVTITDDVDNNEVDVDVAQANIDHDLLLNYVANKHIDHSTVSVTAGTGLTGGGTIAATRTVSLNIDGLAPDAAPDQTQDYVATYDASAATHKKVLLNALPSAGAPTTASYVLLGTDATLTQERVLTAGQGIKFTDAGAGGNLTLDVGTKDFYLNAPITPPQIVANQNDYNPTGILTSNTIRLSSGSSINITGLSNAGDQGRLMVLHNVGANNIVLKDEDALSAAANRFALSNDITMLPDNVIQLWYDGTNSRWRALSSLNSGEANTASNIGIAGVGVFKQKTLVDLEFKKINAGSTKITITDDVANNELDVDVAQTNIDHNLLLNYVENQHINWTSSSSNLLTTGTGGFTDKVTILGNATNAGRVILSEDTDNGSNTIAVAAPASVASDKTLTLPDATDTLVGKATVDIFTNKTFDANGTGNSLTNVDVADLANGTAGQLITWSAAGAPATVATGTLGHILKSNGAGAAPTFQAGGGGGIENVVEDLTPQLGGQLDVNGFALGDGTLELLKFVETAVAVNELTITNAATTTGPVLSATGDDTNIDLNLNGKNTGNVILRDGTDVTKTLSVELAGATTAKKMTLTSSHTDNRTLTLPDATDTLVGVATTDVLLNKTIDAANNTVTVVSADVSDLATSTVIFTNKTLRLADNTAIQDTSGNELILFQVTASAVNEVEITNAATTTNPIIAATGGDADIGLNIQPKGTGAITILGTTTGSATLRFAEDTDNGTNTISLAAPAAIAASATLTLPEATDTLVGKATTDILTNKTIRLADNTAIQDTSGNELILFQVTASAVNEIEITNAATTTNPILAVTGGDTNIGLNIQPKGTGDVTILGTATDSASILLAEDTDNGTNTIGFKAPAALTATTVFTLPDGDGGANTVLSTNGSAVLSWATAGSGNWVKISSSTASASATIDFTGLSTTYRDFVIILSHVLPANDGSAFWIRTSTDNGAAWDAGSNDYEHNAVTGVTLVTDEMQSEIVTNPTSGVGNVSGEDISGWVRLHSPQSALNCHITYHYMHQSTAGARLIVTGSGAREVDADVDGIRFMMGTGNIASGTFTLYGITA